MDWVGYLLEVGRSARGLFWRCTDVDDNLGWTHALKQLWLNRSPHELTELTKPDRDARVSFFGGKRQAGGKVEVDNK